MTTIKVKVARAHACATVDGYLTAGMVGVPCTFEYGPEWDGLRKTAVFTAQALGLMSGGSVSRDVLDADETVNVPAEVMENPGARLHVGVYGWRDDGTIVIPTVMAFVGVILPGADPSGDPGVNPELPVWAQHEVRIKKLEEEGVGSGGNGKPGGYYTPGVSQPDANHAAFTFTPSKDGMAEVPQQTVTLPAGPKGDKGEQGDPGPAGADGKDGVIALTGAKVGDIARVAAVDNNGVPTAWQPVDMPSGGKEWVSLAEVITRENVNSIFVSFDACEAVKGYFVYGAVEDDLGRIGIYPNLLEDGDVGTGEARHAVLEWVTNSNTKRGAVSFEVDTRGSAVWQSTCAHHSRSDGNYDTDITDALYPDNAEIGASNVSHSLITPRYMFSKEVENGILTIRVSGAGMVKGTKLFLWGLKK